MTKDPVPTLTEQFRNEVLALEAQLQSERLLRREAEQEVYRLQKELDDLRADLVSLRNFDSGQ